MVLSMFAWWRCSVHMAARKAYAQELPSFASRGCVPGCMYVSCMCVSVKHRITDIEAETQNVLYGSVPRAGFGYSASQF